MRNRLLLGMFLAGSIVAGCSSDPTASAPSLRIYARTTTTAPAGRLASFDRASFAGVGPGASTDSGSPTTLPIPMYALYLSSNADCSSPIQVQDYGSDGQVKDFVQNPLLFESSPPAGRYHCVILRMSDSFATASNKTFGPCVKDSLMIGDIYRDGESDWKDQDLNPIVGHGTDAAPANDRVAIFVTRDTAAARARGISSNQLIPMTSDLVVPGQATLVWDLTGAIQDEWGHCSILPRPFSFE